MKISTRLKPLLVLALTCAFSSQILAAKKPALASRAQKKVPRKNAMASNAAARSTKSFELPSGCALERSLVGAKKPSWTLLKKPLKKGSPARLLGSKGQASFFVLADKAYKKYLFRGLTECLIPKEAVESEVVSTPAPAEPALDLEAPAPPPKRDNHRGYVAYFGPVYFKEAFQFTDALNNALKDDVSSKSIGFSAGFALEYELSRINLSFSGGIIGAFNSVTTPAPVTNDYKSSGLALGLQLRPSVLYRFGKFEMGPSLPLILRYASYEVLPAGAVTTKNLQPYVSTGLVLKYDFGKTRLAANLGLLGGPKPLYSLELQFEL